MASIPIPKAAHRPLKDLIELSPERVEKLRNAVSNSKPSLSVDRFSRDVAESFDTADRPKIQNIVRELCRMEYGRINSEISAAEFVDSLMTTVGASATDDFNLSETETKSLCERLNTFIGSQRSLNVVAKALSVFADHGRVFIRAKILTDIRPIFADDAKTVDAAAIVHNLSINFIEDDESKTIHIALDSHDTSALRKVLDRADRKLIELKSLVDRSNIPYLEAEPTQP